MADSYQELLDAAYQRKKWALSQKAERKIVELYDNTINSLADELKRTKGTLRQQYLKGRIANLYEGLVDINKTAVTQAAQCAIDYQAELMNEIGRIAGVTSDFSTLFHGIPLETLKAMESGKLYKDGLGLSKRIWLATQDNGATVEKIVKEGMLAGTDSRKIAQVLTNYVNPAAAKPWPKSRVRELLGYTPKDNIDYNAMRLARTSISHAYSLTNRLSADKNPFANGFIWHSAGIHGRTCEVCNKRNGQHFTAKDLPFDHPNGLCWEEPYIEDSLEDIGNQIGDWARGGSDKKLDKWWAKSNKPTGVAAPNEPTGPYSPSKIRDMRATYIGKGSADRLSGFKKATDELIANELGINQATVFKSIPSPLEVTQGGVRKAIWKFGDKSFEMTIGEGNADILYNQLKGARNYKDLENIHIANYIKAANSSAEWRARVYQGFNNQVSDLMALSRATDTSIIKLPMALNQSDNLIPRLIKGSIDENYDFYETRATAGEWLKKYIDASVAPGRTPNLSLLEVGERAFERSGNINIALDDSADVIVHEIGHCIQDAGSDIQRTIKDWFQSRVGGEELSEMHRPGSGEYGYKDNFINHYIGRKYDWERNGAEGTEVLSMGLQYMYQNPDTFYQKDPDFFRLIYGIMRGLS